MKGLRKKSIDMLCGFGKFGLGKSITLGVDIFLQLLMTYVYQRMNLEVK